MKENSKAEENIADAIPLHAVILEDREKQAQIILSVVKDSLKSVSKQTGIPYSLTQETVKSIEEVNYIMNRDDSLPDLVFCDLDLNVKGSGMEVAKRISNELYPTDVLLYSYAGVIDSSEVLPENRYGATLIANLDQIDGKISWLIWKTLLRLSDPEYTRGLILSRTADTETLLDECLFYLFRIHEEQADHFKWDLLRGGDYNWSHKFDVLSRGLSPKAGIKLKEKGINMETIRHHITGIFKFRNEIAHGIVKGDKGGGLFIKNKLSSGITKGTDKLHKKRSEIKKQLSLCHNTEREINSILLYLREDEAKTSS